MEQINNKEEYELVREKIKTRPLNRKKLFRRTVITAVMAVIFGAFACITFLVLEPVFSNMLTPEEKPVANEIKIPQDEDDAKPEDFMLQEEDKTQIIIQETERAGIHVDEYIGLYDQIYEVARNCQKSLVTVKGVSQDVDWFNNEYVNENVTTGIIVANNGIELLILTDYSTLHNSEEIKVSFVDNVSVTGTIKETDKNTGLAVVAVPVSDLNSSMLDPEIIAKLGNSKTDRLIAAPVIALGHPFGNTSSIEYGIVTSKSKVMNMVDNNYELFSTDMYGSSASNGFIFNLSGEVVGVIYQKNNIFVKDILSAIGISDLKKTIERMSNGKGRALLGIKGTDVTAEAMNQGVPSGAYVIGIDMESPAMMAGIQSGDVIVKIDGNEIMSFVVLTEAICSHEAEDEIIVTVKRKSGDEYREIDVPVILSDMR